MVTKIKQPNQLTRSQELAVKRLDAWRQRNAKRLQGWDPVEILRSWRDKRWSSSTHQ